MDDYDINVITGKLDLVRRPASAAVPPSITLVSADTIDYEVCEEPDIDLSGVYTKHTNDVTELKFKRDGVDIDTQAVGP
jgi:hypothetical protein